MSEPFDPYHVWLGIPPDEQPPDHYRLLAIRPFESAPAVIENAADRQMAHLRSVGTGPRGQLAQRLLGEVSQARVSLLDPQLKAAYDARLRAQQASRTASTPVPQVSASAASPAGLTFSLVADKPRSAAKSVSRKRRPAYWPLLIAALGLVPVLAIGVLIAVLLSIAGDESSPTDTLTADVVHDSGHREATVAALPQPGGFGGRAAEITPPIDAPLPQVKPIVGREPTSLAGVVVDDLHATLVGAWVPTASLTSFVAEGYRHDDGSVKGERKAIYVAELDGRHEVRVSYTAHENRATNALVVVEHADGRSETRVNQKQTPAHDGLFQTVGTFNFSPDRPAVVTIDNGGSDGVVVIDAVQFLPVR